MKKEKIYRRKYETMEEVRKDIFRYSGMYYNRKRRHSALEYMIPVEYRLKYDKNIVAYFIRERRIMKVYIDSRTAGNRTHRTLVEVYVNGQLLQTGVLQKATFCCIDMENVCGDELELKFFVIERDEAHKYNRFAKCDLQQVPNLLQGDEYKDFVEYDVDTALTIEDTFNPTAWAYAYSTRISGIDNNTADIILLFDEESVEGVYLCETKGQNYNVSHERIISKEEIFKAYKKWFSKWKIREVIIVPVSVIIFILSTLLICSLDWSPSSGKAQTSLLALALLIFVIIPNAANVMALKDVLKTREFLLNTQQWNVPKK